jgi:hypothetical protein
MDLVGSYLDQGFEKSQGDARGRLLVQFGEGDLEVRSIATNR